jgi:hypothetical protein
LELVFAYLVGCCVDHHPSRTKRVFKKWSAIAAVAVFATFAVAEIVHEFVTNDPIGYFSAKPHRLL